MKTKLTSRIGAILFDNIAIYALGLGSFIQIGIAKETAIWMMSIVFILYTILVPTFFKGYHLGKYLLGMKIVTDKYEDPNFLQIVMRELSKMMYGIPFIGIGFLLVSQFLMAKREDGKSLHDLIAKTRVIRL